MPKDAKGHGSNPRGTSLHKPLPDHAYHGKSDAELHYIVKDATEAAKASQSMGKLETKYNDQVNDAATVLGYRKRLSDGEAASSLRSGSGSKSDPVATHGGAQGVDPNSPLAGSRDYDSFGRPRSADSLREYDEGSRDLSLRSRNGQVGSGMKFRG